MCNPQEKYHMDHLLCIHVAGGNKLNLSYLNYRYVPVLLEQILVVSLLTAFDVTN